MSFGEVAERTGTEIVTARTRLHRALVALRRRLDGLRAMFVMPGVQASALGLALLALQLPAVPRPVSIAGGDPGMGPGTGHRLPARVMAAAKGEKPSEDRAPPPSASTKVDVTEVPAVQKFTFEDEDVLGELLGPDWVPITGETAARHSSLIELRQHFVPEMVKTLEDL
jgi:hypothetical protein